MTGERMCEICFQLGDEPPPLALPNDFCCTSCRSQIDAAEAYFARLPRENMRTIERAAAAAATIFRIMGWKWGYRRSYIPDSTEIKKVIQEELAGKYTETGRLRVDIDEDGYKTIYFNLGTVSPSG